MRGDSDRMSEKEQAILNDIKASGAVVSGVAESAKRVTYFLNGWRCENRKPTAEFVKALKEMEI